MKVFKFLFLILNVFLINQFASAQYSSVSVQNDVYHYGDTDTKMSFISDRISFRAGNEELLRLHEGSQDYVQLGDGGDVDINLNHDMFINGYSGNVGIGTNNPTVKLTVNGDITTSNRHRRGKIRMWQESNASEYFVSHGLGTEPFYNTYGPGIAYSSSIGHKFYVNGYAQAAQIGIGGAGRPANRLDSRFYGDVMIGTTVKAPGHKLSVAGKIACEELKVELEQNWPDYVFQKDYQLTSLEEVEAHIIKQGHLHNTPDAATIEKDGGIELGTITVNQQEKIEELFLHLIAMKKELKILKEKNETLKKQVSKVN